MLVKMKLELISAKVGRYRDKNDVLKGGWLTWIFDLISTQDDEINATLDLQPKSRSSCLHEI